MVRRSHDLTHTLRVKKMDQAFELDWVPNDAATLGYQVWRSNSPFALIATLPADATGYKDAMAPENSKYKVTYYTGDTVEEGFVPATAAPAQLPEWNPEVFVAAAAAAPMVINAPEVGASFWVALGEALLLFIGLSLAVSQPEATAKHLRSARSGVLRFTAQFTLSLVVLGERFERALGVRLMSRFNDREILELFRFAMMPEAAPKPTPAEPSPEATPRLSVSRLHRGEHVEAPPT